MPDLFVNPQRDPQSEYTQNLPQVLRGLAISLILATKRGLVILRSKGDELNTHFIDIQGGVQGLYADSQMLVAGTSSSVKIWRLVPPDSNKGLTTDHDGYFLPLKQHHTGDINCGEIVANNAGELYFVNTLFSCISRINNKHSFVPVWQPAFVSACTPEDRCHLSGVALNDGNPAYVTALARSDTAGGWRDQLQSAGVIVEVESGCLLAEGLCVPASPRWHAGQLWLLEAGSGRLCKLEHEQVIEVAHVPGFARGLAFIGQYAFITISRVRHGGSLPICTSESSCGVWMIDTETGQTIAFLRFGVGLDEIYAVSVLAGLQNPAVLTEDNSITKSIYRLPE